MQPVEEVVVQRLVEGGIGGGILDAGQKRCHRREAHERRCRWWPAARAPSTSSAVPTRSTVRTRRQSAMVGETPAAWATARSVAELADAISQSHQAGPGR